MAAHQRAHSSDDYPRWGVPRGTERRPFLAVWFSMCVLMGCSNVQGAWQAISARPQERGLLLTLAIHALYVLHYSTLVAVLAFRPSVYRRYKLLFDMSHLHGCLLTHLVEAAYPISGSVRPVDWAPTHATALLLNTVFHNLPIECMFELMATGLPAHLLIHHVSIRSHLGPSVSWATYASLMAQVLLNAPAASLVVALLAGRTDMAPSGARLAALQRVKSGQAQPGAAALSEDAPAPPLPFATRALVAVHRAQLFVQEHMQPAVVAASAVVGLWALLRGFRAITQRTDMRLCLHISEYLLLIPSLYMLGTQNVLTTLKPRLAGALTLLYDLVPQHIAEALMEQDQSSGSEGARSQHTSSSLSPDQHVPAQRMPSQPAHPCSVTPSELTSQGTASVERLPSGHAASSPHAPLLARSTTLPSPSASHLANPAAAPPHAELGGTDLARASHTQGADAAAVVSQLQQAATHLAQEQKRGAAGAAAPLLGRQGSWRPARLMSGVLDSLKESLVERPAPRLPEPGPGGPTATGQLVQVPEALTLDGHVSRTPQIASWHEHTSIFFCDIESFTDCCQAVQPAETMAMLNELFFRIDGLCMGESRVTKIETVGDCVMAATGLLHDDPDHAITMLEFAAALQHEAGQVLYPHNGRPLRVRVGIHSGRVMSGVVGRIRKRYCLFGDTVNTASRMESNGQPGRIHVSQATYDLVMASPRRDEWRFECRGEIPIKGKGLMVTYWAERAEPTTQ